MTRLLIAFALANFAFAIPAFAQAQGFHLRTVPPVPIAGQPFVVMADGGGCTRLFVGDLGGTGENYDRVTVSPGLIQVQVGVVFEALCEPPHTVSVAVQRLPEGTYRLELIGRLLFTTETGVLQATNITVANASAPSVARVPSSTLPFLIALGLAVTLMATNSLSISSRTHP